MTWSFPLCPGCGRTLERISSSIPEAMICYKAGVEDTTCSGNRIVDEWVCPVGGLIHSPGGGICIPGWEKKLSCYREKD